LPFGTSCCAAELTAAFGPRYDIGRFGVKQVADAPRQADLLVVAGRISTKMVTILEQTYEAMQAPKWVLAFGSCASTGGSFDTYAVTQGLDRLLPVDVYVPGCPPEPEDLIDGLRLLQRKIRSGDRAT
jgi:NADH-quinone oxidoreductase subunit B